MTLERLDDFSVCMLVCPVVPVTERRIHLNLKVNVVARKILCTYITFVIRV